MSSRTQVIAADRDHPDPMVVAEAARILRSGGLVAFGTETVYGLGADATNPQAVHRIYEAKGRPSSNPLIVHVETLERARDCTRSWDERTEVLAKTFWPGPLTIVLPRSELIPAITAGGFESVGIRMPEPPIARALIAAIDRPIAAPSANRSNRVSPTLACHVLADLDGLIDLILDSGPANVGLESTVLDLTSSIPRILRPGSILRGDLETVLGQSLEELTPLTPRGSIPSPGNLAVHYAPRTPCLRVDLDQIAFIDLEQRALICIGQQLDSRYLKAERIFHLARPAEAARDLYATLHLCDAGDFLEIVIINPPSGPEWVAIRDRIGRASRPFSRTNGADPKE